MEASQSPFVSAAEKEVLLKYISNPSSSLVETERKFKESFPSKGQQDAVAHELAILCSEFIIIGKATQLISSIQLLHVLVTIGLSSAKYALYAVLVQLEKALKRDIFEAKAKESVSKEADGRKKNLETVSTEIYRIHSCAKVFLLNLLSGSVSREKRIADIVSQNQEALDSQIENLESHSAILHSVLGELHDGWKAANESNKRSSKDSTALVETSLHYQTSIQLPTIGLIKLPIAPVFLGELQFLIVDQNGSPLLFNA